MRIDFPLSMRFGFLATLSVALMAIAGLSASHDASAVSHPVVWGDVTCDNVVDLRDVADLMRRSSRFESSTNCPGDAEAPASIQASTPAVTLRLDPTAASAGPGESITISIFSDVHATGIGLGSAAYDLVFDPSRLTPISCSAANGDCNVTFTPNSTRFAFSSGSAEGWVGTRKLGQVQYLVIGAPGRSTNLRFAAIKLGDQSGTPMTSEAIGATIAMAATVSSPTPVPTVAPTIPPGAYWYYADVNCDGVVTVLDALGVLSYLALGQSGFAAAGSCPTIGS